MMFKLIRTISCTVVGYVVLGMIEPMVERSLYTAYLVGLPQPKAVMVPVHGMRPSAVHNTWHANRDGGRRRHEGIDLFAPKGTPVRATTEGIIRRISTSKLGGKVVWVLGPAGQRHYYAHLDGYAYIRTGQRIQKGAVLGYVGNTGNARYTPSHLHYGIYGASGAINPFPLLKHERHRS
jgi:murein DD-endopeptidase MepM/ murein hydrolase activator NlpD